MTQGELLNERIHQCIVSGEFRAWRKKWRTYQEGIETAAVADKAAAARQVYPVRQGRGRETVLPQAHAEHENSG